MKQKPPLPPREGLERMMVSDLKPHERNARTHSKKQVRQIADSIGRFGFTNPVLCRWTRPDHRRARPGGSSQAAGHGRACRRSRCRPLTEAERRAYVLADNKLARNCRLGQGNSGHRAAGDAGRPRVPGRDHRVQPGRDRPECSTRLRERSCWQMTQPKMQCPQSRASR